MTSVYVELVLVTLGAMLSPTTLSFAVLALVLGDRPLRTGLWFYIGALGATLAVGFAAVALLGGSLSSHSSSPKTWVAVVDVVAGLLVLAYAVKLRRRPADPDRVARMIERMGKIASSPAIAIVAAGATLANPGGFIPLAVKDISQLDPSRLQAILVWTLFALLALLPLGVALLLLIVARDHAMRILTVSRRWLERHAVALAIVILVLLGLVLLRNGITGLT